MTLGPLSDSYAESRATSYRLATHIVSRSHHAATGRIWLQPTPGGFGTPDYGPDQTRVRISGDLLVVDVGDGDAPGSRARPIAGSSLAELADFAGVELTPDFSVGPDTSPIGDLDEPLTIVGDDVRVVGAWYALTNQVLDALTSHAPAAATPTIARLWPEHFDTAIDIGVGPGDDPGRRANIGGSPGDAFSAEPYLYVGPWAPDRPGDDGYWNAPFGAVLTYSGIAAHTDPLATAVAFAKRGLALLS